jgi:hypothetical protein
VIPSPITHTPILWKHFEVFVRPWIVIVDLVIFPVDVYLSSLEKHYDDVFAAKYAAQYIGVRLSWAIELMQMSGRYNVPSQERNQMMK